MLSSNVSSSVHSPNVPFDLQDGEFGKNIAFAIAHDGTGETEILQPCDGFGAHHLSVGEKLPVVVVEMKVFKRIEDAALTGDHAVVTAQRQMAGENLEYAFTVGRTVFSGENRQAWCIRMRSSGRVNIQHFQKPCLTFGGN